jgi:membrane-associated protein
VAQRATVEAVRLPRPPGVLTALLDSVANWPAAVVLVVAALVLVVESGTLVGVALPGTTLLVALGLWSHIRPDALLPAIALSAAATVTGAHIGWWRGRSGHGVPALGGDGRHRRVLRAGTTRAHRWLAGRGPVATAALLACGHWAAAARPLVPRVAGGAGVPYRIAGPPLILSGTAWAATLVLLGNQVGPHVLTQVGAVPLVVVALLVGALTLHSRWRHKSIAAESTVR